MQDYGVCVFANITWNSVIQVIVQLETTVKYLNVSAMFSNDVFSHDVFDVTANKGLRFWTSLRSFHLHVLFI